MLKDIVKVKVDAAAGRIDFSRVGPDAEKTWSEPEGTRNELKTCFNRTGLFRVIYASLVACLGSLTGSFVGAYVSPAIPDLNANRNPYHVTRELHTWVVSAPAFGSLVGALMTANIADRCGRKMVMMLAACISTAAWLTVVTSYNPAMLMIGRVLMGFGSSAVGCLATQLYVAEISPAEHRGQLMSLITLLYNTGILLMYVLGASVHWNWLAVACLLPSVIQTVLAAPLPDTPRWFLMQGRVEEATDALAWFRGSSDIQPEVLNIQSRLTSVASVRPIAWAECFQPPLLRTLAISQVLFLLQNFSGISVVRAYTVTIFGATGSELNPYSQTVVVGAIFLAGSIVFCVVVERFARRALLICSSTIMAVGWAAMGGFFYIMKADAGLAIRWLYWLPLASLMVVVFGGSLGVSTLPVIISNELFSTQARSRASCLTLFSNSLSAFLVIKYFVGLSSLIGDHFCFWLFGVNCLLGSIFVYFFVPETKGKVLEEIDTVKI